MDHVTSADGTLIAYQRNGTGSPLILVHGALADHTRWNPLMGHINEHFTTYAMDRRGRGRSGDALEYSYEHEVQDVVAVSNSINSPANLYGHSSGATYALEAAPTIRTLRRLVLYEPVIPEVTGLPQPGDIDRIENLIGEGKREKALVIYLRDIVQIPAHEIEELRNQPSWPARLAAAHTVVREERSWSDYHFNPRRFADMQVPTLLLMGSESPPSLRLSVEELHGVLPNSRIRELPGQQHAADIMAPEIVASALIDFLGKK